MIITMTIATTERERGKNVENQEGTSEGIDDTGIILVRQQRKTMSTNGVIGVEVIENTAGLLFGRYTLKTKMQNAKRDDGDIVTVILGDLEAGR
jgi:hypothetical protein